MLRIINEKYPLESMGVQESEAANCTPRMEADQSTCEARTA